MKSPDLFEIILYWTIALLVVGFSIWLGITMMGDKNRMCRDFGKVVYQRELTWIECMSL